MKANAPKKIYVQMSRYWYGIDSLFYPVRQHKNDTEYIRTDAFIEKACVWIKENLLKHTYVYEGEVSMGMAVFLEDFKQAMKGE